MKTYKLLSRFEYAIRESIGNNIKYSKLRNRWIIHNFKNKGFSSWFYTKKLLLTISKAVKNELNQTK